MDAAGVSIPVIFALKFGWAFATEVSTTDFVKVADGWISGFYSSVVSIAINYLIGPTSLFAES